MKYTNHPNFMGYLQESFDMVGYKDKEVNKIILDRLNEYYKYIQELEVKVKTLEKENKQLNLNNSDKKMICN
jgi:hypothetical protein